MFWTVRGVKPSGSKARTRIEAEPNSSCAARTHGLGGCLAGHQRGGDDGHAQRHAQHREAVRSGRLARLRHASADRRTR